MTTRTATELNLHKFFIIFSNTIAPSSGKSSKLPLVPKMDTTIRAKRLMKELKDLQKQRDTEDRIFEVNEERCCDHQSYLLLFLPIHIHRLN
jgi:hypothetical protein